MTNAQAEVAVISVRCEQMTFPPYDAFHGTPSPMLWRKVSFETPQGMAAFEQTDYGHPGRLNPWEPRGIATALVPKLAQLRAAAEALGALM
ncbi:MAG TPA: hypothetical protein VJB57_14330 [Dehalococcoidia bacterium]|nr:hypothetical protein [Dehalococcoidia bacterium]